MVTLYNILNIRKDGKLFIRVIRCIMYIHHRKASQIYKNWVSKVIVYVTCIFLFKTFKLNKAKIIESVIILLKFNIAMFAFQAIYLSHFLLMAGPKVALKKTKDGCFIETDFEVQGFRIQIDPSDNNNMVRTSSSSSNPGYISFLFCMLLLNCLKNRMFSNLSIHQCPVLVGHSQIRQEIWIN